MFPLAMATPMDVCTSQYEPQEKGRMSVCLSVSFLPPPEAPVVYDLVERADAESPGGLCSPSVYRNRYLSLFSFLMLTKLQAFSHVNRKE